MSLQVWLRLGRVSNLPTVWSNVLAALALSGALQTEPRVLVLAVAFSVFYVGGMYLNDAFDHRIDAIERPTRPIPSGQVSATTVYALGFVALALGTLVTALVASSTGASTAGASVVRAAGSGVALAGCIVFYDVWHKKNPLSPLVMGACRVLVYIAVAYAVSKGPSAPVLLGAAALWCHLIGLTYAAKQEAYNRLTRVWPLAFLAVPALYGIYLAIHQPLVWPFAGLLVAWVLYTLRFLRPGPGRAVPQAVVRLIAGISLVDAILVASSAPIAWALLAAALCPLTRVFQKVVPGT